MSALDMMGGGGPPPSIPLPGGGDPGAGGGGQPGPDTPDVEQAVQDAIDSLGQALDGENDPPDKATLAKIIADLHKFLGDQQNLLDKAVGAGPGAKIVRKAAGGPTGTAGY